MIKASEATQRTQENQEVRDALLRVQAYKLGQNPSKKIVNIEKKIEQAIEDDKNFTFFGCKTQEADLMRVFFETMGYTVKRQAGVAGEEIYKLTW